MATSTMGRSIDVNPAIRAVYYYKKTMHILFLKYCAQNKSIKL